MQITGSLVHVYDIGLIIYSFRFILASNVSFKDLYVFLIQMLREAA